MRYQFPFVAVALVLMTISCSASPASPAGTGKGSADPDPVAQLRRPWMVERLQPETPCPVTTTATRPDQALGPVQGGWLAGPMGLGADGRLEYAAPDVGGQWADPTWAGWISWQPRGAPVTTTK